MSSKKVNVQFLIKHKSSGKFIHPEGGSANPADNTRLVIDPSIHERMYFEFEEVKDEGHFGYIRHVASGKAIHPKNGDIQPSDNTDLVLHSCQHAACLFGIDEVSHWILHKSGVSFHTYGGKAFPDNGTKVILHSGHHDLSKWIFVDPKNPEEEVNIYDKPTVIGQWRIVNQILDPKATHTYEIEVKIGKSKSESSSATVESSIESSISASDGFLTASISSTLRAAIEESSEETWSEEQTQKRTIEGNYICR